MSIGGSTPRDDELAGVPHTPIWTRQARAMWPMALWWAIGTHTIVATCLVARGDSFVGVLAILAGITFFLGLGIPPLILAGMLYAVSALAAYSLIHEFRLERRWHLGLIAPQWFVVTTGLLASIDYLATGEVLGREVDRWFILGGLASQNVSALCHQIAILNRYVVRWPAR